MVTVYGGGRGGGIPTYVVVMLVVMPTQCSGLRITDITDIQVGVCNMVANIHVHSC